MPEDLSSKELADHFSDYFHNKIMKIRSKLEIIPDYEPPVRNVPKMENFEMLTVEHVIKIITKLGIKQCELDKFPTKLLVTHKESIALPVCELVNKSLESGLFPECWKEGMVKPQIKNVTKETTDNNYRPVSNLKHLSKILECAARLQIVHHCQVTSYFLLTNLHIGKDSHVKQLY